MILKAVVANSQKKNILLNCEIINGDSSQVFYKPEEWNFCASLSHIILKDHKSGTQLSYLPCTAITDLDRVILSAKNTVMLKSGEAFRFTVPISTRGILPALKAGKSYVIQLLLNHESLCGGEKCTAFTGKMRSNTSVFTMK